MLDLYALVEAALLIDVMLAIMLARAALPFSSPLVQLFAPIPIAVVSARHGIRPALLALIVCWIVISGSFGVTSGIWGILYGLVGLSVGGIIRHKAPWWGLPRLFLIYTFLFGAAMVAVAQTLGLNVSLLAQRFRSTAQSLIMLIQSIGLDERFVLLLSFVVRYPLFGFLAGYLPLCLVYSTISYAVAVRVLRRLS